MAEEAAKERKFEVLTGSRFQEASQARNAWFITVASKTNPDDLLVPAYWAHVGTRLRVRDRIEVWAEDGSWFCELVVVDCARTWAKAKFIIDPVRLDKGVTADQAGAGAAIALYDIRHRGPKGWSVVRKSDKAVLHEDEMTRDGAEKWLAENIAALKVAA